MKTRTNQPIELMNTLDIEHLPDDFLDTLKAGDILTKQTGNQKHTYVVSYKEEKHGICITYVACGYMETISYDYTDGHWVFNSKDVIEVPTLDDVEQDLVGKYVRIMNAPTSTTLTDEQIAQIREGVFINGEFLSHVNPVLFPFKETAGSYKGLILSSSIIGVYTINPTTKVISLDGSTSKSLYIRSIFGFNGKDIPDYPASTGTFVLKCVDGVLTWVSE